MYGPLTTGATRRRDSGHGLLADAAIFVTNGVCLVRHLVELVLPNEVALVGKQIFLFSCFLLPRRLPGALRLLLRHDLSRRNLRPLPRD